MTKQSVLHAALLLALVLTACASPSTTSGPPQGAEPADRPTGPKRIKVAFTGNPPGVASRLTAGAAGGTGVADLEAVLNRGLTGLDHEGVRRPELAESVPTVENGLWKVFPDGRMETTWKLRTGVRWQDGTPFSTEDLLFTARVDQDRDLPLRPDAGYRSVEAIEAPDSTTVVVKWKTPYIKADSFFAFPPLPRHLLEQGLPRK